MGVSDLLFGGSGFEDHEAAMHDAVIDQFGEWFEHQAIIPPKPNFSDTLPDPERPAYLIRACFSHEHVEVLSGSGSPGVSTRKPILSLRKCDFRWSPRRGDRFTSIKTGETFEAKDIQRDSLSGIVIPVSQCGRMQV